MTYKIFEWPVLTEDANGIAQDQTTSEAADLNLNGVLVSGGVATTTNSTAQQVLVEGSGDNTGITFAITGTDANGQTQTETLTGVSNGAAKTTAYFVTVTTIRASGAVTGNVEVGWLATHGAVTNAYVVNHKQSPYNQSFSFDLTAGSMTVSAQYTVDPPDPTHYGLTAWTNTYSTDAEWKAVDGLSGVTADDQSNLAFPVRAVRWIQTVGSTTGAATVTNIQGQGL